MKTEAVKNWTDNDHLTWKQLYARLEDNRRDQAHPLFQQGLDALGISEDRIPDMEAVNRELYHLSGWRGLLVEGLEGPESFYPALAKKEFPIGNFIREQEDLNYTPAPDIFHDCYGHLPFYANSDYADACADFCQRVIKYIHEPSMVKMFERFFWFTYEFALVETPKGRRIFGGGLLSSKGESNYALSSKPHVKVFNIEEMIHQDFRIDIFQEKLFVLKCPEQLYESNKAVELAVSKAAINI